MTFFSSKKLFFFQKSTFFELSKTLVKRKNFAVVQLVGYSRFHWQSLLKLYYISTIYRRFAPKCHLVHIYRMNVRIYATIARQQKNYYNKQRLKTAPTGAHHGGGADFAPVSLGRLNAPPTPARGGATPPAGKPEQPRRTDKAHLKPLCEPAECING